MEYIGLLHRAIAAVGGWLGSLFHSTGLTIFFISLVSIYTITRLFLVPLFGQGISDHVRSIRSSGVKGNGD